MVSPRPVNMKSIQASLSGIEEIKLPVVTDVDDLTRLDMHLFTYLEVEARVLDLPIVRNGGEDSGKIRLDIPQQETQ